MGERGPTRQPGSIRWYEEGRQFHQARSEMPDKPDWLSGEASRVWDELVPQLYVDGIPILKIDSASLSVICVTRGWMVELQSDMRHEDMILKGPRGKDYENPKYKIWRDLSKIFLAWAQQFGMTPRSRQRLELVTHFENDPLEAHRRELAILHREVEP